MPRRSVSRVLAGIPGAPQVAPYAGHGPRAGHAAPPAGVAVPPLAGALTRHWQPAFPLDWSRTLAVHRRGRGDPAYLVDAYGAAWRTSLTPDGPATMRVHAVPAGGAGRAVPARDPGRGVAARYRARVAGGCRRPVRFPAVAPAAAGDVPAASRAADRPVRPGVRGADPCRTGAEGGWR